ncbi:1635_t:CDS:2 [Funneliformis caledonium]|uniref:RecQ-mediated genome instability protein 1 n=1 Tax=Funneliformis caledonium TaxID=1117310 RepID=A0A9N9AW73_9GLOM|nr:1635_t:CDS:2 [Funneliformis caledonium]
MVPSEINESIFTHIEMTFSKTTFEFRRDGLEKALTKVLSEKEMIHINELLNRIFFELLHSDLSDVIYPTLPNLNEFQNGIIAQNGPILLEIVECIEVGIPTYKLLQILNEFESTQANITEENNRESEKQLEFPRKMLYLLLSDGQQKIKGMEYKRIPELSLNTPIGKKVLINNAKYAENVLFLTPENTFICDGFEWTSRRLGDLKLTFMEILGMTIDESIEDESQISFNTLHPCDNPAFLSGVTGGRLARVVFEDVPNMPDLTKLKRFLLKAETSNQHPRIVPLYNKNSCPEPIFRNSTRPNIITRVPYQEPIFNNLIQCNSSARTSFNPEPQFDNSARSNSLSRTLIPRSNLDEKTPFIKPTFIASSKRSNSEEDRSSYYNTSRSHLSISSNEPDFNASPIRSNSGLKETEQKVSSSMLSNCGIDPFSVQDDLSYMLIEEKFIPVDIRTNNDNDKKQNQDFFDDFRNDDNMVLIDSDDCDLPPADVLCHNKKDVMVIIEEANDPNHISKETKNKLLSLFENLEDEYKAMSSESDIQLPSEHSLSISKDFSAEHNSTDNNKKRSWLYEEIDCDSDTSLEIPPLKKVHTDDHEKKLDGGSLTNPIHLDYDDNDYEMDLG